LEKMKDANSSKKDVTDNMMNIVINKEPDYAILI
jgi:hypothetical protein